MKGINYDKKESISRNCKIVRYGKYVETTDDETNQPIIEVLSSIDEFTFYKIYLELNNVIRYKNVNGKLIDFRMSEAPIELMAHIMTKSLDYTIIYRNKDAKLIELADEIDRTPSSIYASMNKLRKSHYLIKNEDKQFVSNNELQDLMKKTKECIENNEALTFDFLFKFCMYDRPNS